MLIDGHEELKQPLLQKNLESVVENTLNKNIYSPKSKKDSKIISLEDKLKEIRPKVSPLENYHPEEKEEDITYYLEFLKYKEKLNAKESLNRGSKSGASVFMFLNHHCHQVQGIKFLACTSPQHIQYISQKICQNIKSNLYIIMKLPML